MELGLILKAILSLIFVLGLLFLTLWTFKTCQIKGSKSFFMKKLQQNKRIKIIENQKIDLKNSLLLFSRDDTEYLILLGNSQNLLLETRKNNTQDSANV